jgi:hypothetical protein
MLIFNWAARQNIALKKTDKQGMRLFDAYCALDYFVQDALGAPSDISDWLIITDTEIVWKGVHECVGWKSSESALHRTAGAYVNGQWKQSTKSLISNTIAHTHFQLHKSKDGGQVIRIACAFDDATRDIALLNRRFDGKRQS